MRARCAWRCARISAAASRGCGTGTCRCCAAPNPASWTLREPRAASRWCRTPTGWRTGAFAGRAWTTARKPTSTTARIRCTAWAGAGPGRSSRPAPWTWCWRYRHAADADWPFAFEARQYFTLTPQAMRVQMVFDNLAEVAQPVGLGWHPYFPKRARSRLHIELDGRWDSDAAQLPVRKVAQSGIDATCSTWTTTTASMAGAARHASVTRRCRYSSAPRSTGWWCTRRSSATTSASSR